MEERISITLIVSSQQFVAHHPTNLEFPCKRELGATTAVQCHVKMIHMWRSINESLRGICSLAQYNESVRFGGQTTCIYGVKEDPIVCCCVDVVSSAAMRVPETNPAIRHYFQRGGGDPPGVALHTDNRDTS
jgi:hypothetical protein